MLLRCSAFGC
uniref:Uncharacterized protein n=1 Tax=Anguilla anguilla TaxID=7936 RepID=A0A0E9VD68_ANGAN